MNIYIRERMLEVLNAAYPDLFTKYKSFMLLTECKEQKKTSKYIFEKKTIVIRSLSRSPADIFISCLVELARHIDIINRQETHDDQELFAIIKKLLITSINLNIIKISDLKSYSDDKIKKNLKKYYHSFDYWKFNILIKPKYVYIFVDEAFMIKNVLKTNGYHYDPLQNLWIKKIPSYDTASENDFTDYYSSKADFTIIGDNSFYIRPVYQLKLKTYAKGETALLKALDFRYDKIQHVWKKLIIASNIDQELKNIEKIPRQRLIISKNA